MSDDRPARAAPTDPPPRPKSTTRGRILAIGVAAVAVSIIAYKELGPRAAPSAHAAAAAAAAAPAAAAAAPAPASAGSVLLFADPRQANESCGCGQIIRLVRGARARGVVVREIAPGSNPAVEHEYRVTVTPTVVFLDSRGRVASRHVGEARATLAAIRAALQALTPRR